MSKDPGPCTAAAVERWYILGLDNGAELLVQTASPITPIERPPIVTA